MVGIASGANKTGERPRRWSYEEKLAILEEMTLPGAVMAVVARRYKNGTSQPYTWRKQLLGGTMPGSVPVEVMSPEATKARISEVLDTQFTKSWTSVSQSPGQLTRFGQGCLVEFQAVMISAFSPWVKRDGARVLRMLSPSRAMR